MKNIKLTLKKVPDYLSTELKEKYKEFIKPENIKIVAGAMALTKNNKGLIYNRKVKIDELEQKAWLNGEKTAREDHRIYKNDANVGYANGKETQYLEIKKTGNEIHGHPITEERYNELKSKGKK